MQNIFVVTESGGSYDDYWITNHKAFFQRPDAEVYIEEQKALKILLVKEREILQKFKEEYVEENPWPPYPKRIDYPRFPAGISQKDITPAMRKEREDILALNRKNEDEHRRLWLAYNEAQRVVLEAFVQAQGLKNELNNLLSSYAEETEWDIEELEIR